MLHYLKASLIGDAASLMSNIRVTEANFEETWRKLTDEYENTLLISSHLNTITDLSVIKIESANGLRSLRDTVSFLIAALRSLERPVDNWDDWLVHILIKKLAQRTRQK